MSAIRVVSGDFFASTTRRAQSRSETIPTSALSSCTTTQPISLSAMIRRADRTESAGPTAHRVRGFDARTSLKDRKAKISSGRLMGCSMLPLDPLERLRVRANGSCNEENSLRYYSNVGSIRQYTLV